MAQNRELLKKLKEQMNSSSLKADQLQKAIENLTQELQDKDTQLTQLRDELDKKDIHIAELDETIANLNNDVENLRTEGEQKTQTINTQDKQLHTAWFVYGTKEELRQQNILDKHGRVLQGGFNKEYFTKIDYRIDKEIKFYSKTAEMLTAHPASSYELKRDANKQYSLRITDPDLFWSTSKYLVVMVK